MKLTFIKTTSLLALLSIGLCGCPREKYYIYIRNNSNDSAYLNLISSGEPFCTQATIPVIYSTGILPIKRKTTASLHDTLMAYCENSKASLAIPPNSTAYITDFIDQKYFVPKQLTIRTGASTDSMEISFPFNRVKHIKKKRILLYIVRTSLYYDTKKK